MQVITVLVVLISGAYPRVLRTPLGADSVNRHALSANIVVPAES
jgi:hypothetical protein